MDRWTQLLLACIAAFLVFLGSFIGIVFAWSWVDTVGQSREVSRFVAQNQDLVARWSANPKVHSLELAPMLSRPSILSVRFDVDDKETYLKLREELSARMTGLRLPYDWRANLRSKEDLGNNWDLAGERVNPLAEGLKDIEYAGVASLVVAGVFLRFCLRRLGPRQESRSQG